MALEEESPETIGAVVETNLTATLQACRLVIPRMIRQGGGVLINMSGRGGRGEPTPFLPGPTIHTLVIEPRPGR
jgi:NADP-dependent 3-hydroxy acid dehydrogenase YdfG